MSAYEDRILLIDERGLEQFLVLFKKSLSERVHYDKSGFVMHRDLFSSYLARFVNQDELSLQDAINQYPGSEPILVEAWKQYQQSVNRVSASESGLTDSPLVVCQDSFEG